MWRPGWTRPMVCSVTLSLLATGAIEMTLPSRYRWTYPGSAGVVPGFSVLAPVSLTLTWTVRAWMTAPFAGVMIVSLAVPPGRAEVGGPVGPLAAWPLPPHAAADTTTAVAARNTLTGPIAPPPWPDDMSRPEGLGEVPGHRLPAGGDAIDGISPPPGGEGHVRREMTVVEPDQLERLLGARGGDLRGAGRGDGLLLA